MLFPTTTALNSKAKIILTLREGLLSMQKAVLSSARILNLQACFAGKIHENSTGKTNLTWKKLLNS